MLIWCDLCGLPGTFQAVRALTVVGIVLGFIGAMIALFSLKCYKMGSMEDSSKAKMTLTAGVTFIIAGRGTRKVYLSMHVSWRTAIQLVISISL